MSNTQNTQLEFLRAKYPVTADIVKTLIETEMSGWTASEGIAIYVDSHQKFNFKHNSPELQKQFSDWLKERQT